MKLFNGKLVILVKSTEKAGDIKVNVSGKGLKTANLMLKAKK
jgi:beta-galactosidase